MNTASDAGRLAPAELGPVGVVDDWMAGFRQVDGIYQVSPPRPFAHDEAQFDAGLRLDADTESIGNGLLAELRREGFDFALPALEIGCGSGSLSVGLARNGGFSRLILSDPSPCWPSGYCRSRCSACAWSRWRIRVCCKAIVAIGGGRRHAKMPASPVLVFPSFRCVSACLSPASST
jgi:hypothetical protein